MRRPRGTPRQRRCIGRVVVALGAVVMLAATSCIHVPVPLSYRLTSAMECDGVLPEGVVCRQSPSTAYVCIFGATDPATQDVVVEAARESLRGMGRSHAIVQFWSGEPPPRGVPISIKETGRPRGEPPSTEQAESNARYGISLIRAVTVRVEAPPGETTP